MATSFTLSLDTTAPAIEWGAVAGTSAGQLLQVAYTIDEPGILTAELELPDGRELPVAIHDARLEVLLPPDAGGGFATLRVDVIDDLGNAATVEHMILLSGVFTTPTGPGRSSHPTWSPEDVPDPPRTVVWAISHLTLRSADQLLAVHFARTSRSVSSSRNVVRRRTLASSGRTAVRSTGRTGILLVTPPARASALASGRVTSRRDGRSLEEALLLDLL